MRGPPRCSPTWRPAPPWRGRHAHGLAPLAAADEGAARLADGAFTTTELRRLAGPVPAEADPAAGLIPLAAVPEHATSAYHWPLAQRDRVWSARVGGLVDRAARQQWNAVTDVPWQAVEGLPPTSSELWPR